MSGFESRVCLNFKHREIPRTTFSHIDIKRIVRLLRSKLRILLVTRPSSAKIFLALSNIRLTTFAIHDDVKLVCVVHTNYIPSHQSNFSQFEKEEELAMMYGYVRASKEEQQITIGAQEERIREYCKLYGIELAGIAFEHASGKNIKDRPVFKELLSRKDLTGIVVASLDRFSRSMKDFCNLMDNEMKGRTLISVKEKFDATDPIGAFTIQIMMAFAELERKTIGKRTKDALAEKKRRGEKLGGRLGMESNADGKTIQLLVKELRTEGLTIRGIAERLRNDNVTYEGKELSIATIHRLSKVA